ncbi:peptidase [Roseobacter sp. YSTF-M11]|uniref:Peptidase n=1 Tax=Roseobacter insulae TaxID=2859783 RepID=A0A9X1FVQ7_9RHOB|nr:peptidase [Roseobacter insulae]MBW4708543.1 peptidase [Roseobacter insulae]
MTEFSQKIVQEARAWIGTPYVHQSSVRGAGTDCLGLLRGIWRALYDGEPEEIPAYSYDWSEPQGEEKLWEAALRHLVAKDLNDEDAGDVLLFRMRAGAVAKHLGVAGRIGADASFLHAYSGHGVKESSLSLPWRRRIVARFQFPEEAT